MIECPEKALHTQIAHKINNICSSKYYSNFFDHNKNVNELKKNASLNEKDASKKNIGQSSSQISSQNENSLGKKESQKKVNSFKIT